MIESTHKNSTRHTGFEDSLVQTKSTLAVRHVLMRPKREWSWANAIQNTTGLVRLVSDRFVQAGSDPVLLILRREKKGCTDIFFQGMSEASFFEFKNDVVSIQGGARCLLKQGQLISSHSPHFSLTFPVENTSLGTFKRKINFFNTPLILLIKA